ncbi:MAG: hypothetical protein K6G91_00215, partial [Kiritimatiellae bacterium]|nr:hypothetical protein [Kiritimatiellia bacterium]
HAAELNGPEVWLEFMGGNVRKDGLRCDLEAVKDAGFSGVHFFHISRGEAWPECPEQIPCMSEKWGEVVRFLGDECARLGLALTVQNCPGWSQSGGPWIDLDHCMRDIECVRADFSGGDIVKIPGVPEKFGDAASDWRDICVLAFPAPLGDECSAMNPVRPVSVTTNGDERIYTFSEPTTIRSMTLPGLNDWNPDYVYHTPWLRVSLEAKMADGWRDALRTPLPVSSWRDYVHSLTLACDERTANVWRYRVEHDYPVVKWGEPQFFTSARQTDWEAKSGRVLRSLLNERPPVQDSRSWVDGSKIVDLTCVSAWKAPSGKWTVLRFGHVNAKRVNAPAPKEATGWECDKLDPKGIEANFDGYIRKLLDGSLKERMHGMLVDSWECFGQTWTARMEEYFRNANGYDLRRHLPSLFGYVIDSPEATERFLTDWRRTNGDLITKNYYGRMAELAHEAGLEVYYETAFGDIICGDLLEHWKYADAPMCEFWHPHDPKDKGGVGTYAFKPVRPCASAAHIYGKRRVVAEAFTGWGIGWDEDFKRLQDTANRHFARGVTHLAYQSYTHAPSPTATSPGGCMGGFNGTPFTRLQTWWRYMPEFNGYITRCEKFLEAGLPAQDVLWYLGDAVDHKPDEDYPFPEGFRADYLNHDVLTNRLSVKDGQFVVPEGTSWKVLWVPDERCMLSATRKRLAELAAAGGKVVFGGKDELVKTLATYAKDVATEPALGDGPSEDFMWIHRKADGFDSYFVAAGTNGWRGKVTFRASGVVSLYDPVSQERTAWRNGEVLEILPSRSVFVEFGGEATNLVGRVVLNAPQKCHELTGWALSFPSCWGAPEKIVLERPVAWCEIIGLSREAHAFSGTVSYETEFICDREWGRLELDLGRVESIAKVIVNGQAVRTLWCEPFRCDITPFVKQGANKLRIEVTNTWRNRVIYDLGQPEKDRKTWIVYQPANNPGPTDPFTPSGILGPVFLRCVDPTPDEKLAERIASRHKIIGQDSWYGYQRTIFDFEGHRAWIVEPNGKWRDGHPWTWTMQWAEAYVERTGVLDLLAKGWRHVTIDTFEHRMDEEGLRVSRAFQKYLVQELGFAPRAKLVGMSWGGFFSVRYATTFPECVERIYLDAPLLTLDGGTGAATEIGPWTAMPPKDCVWHDDPRMPLNMAEPLAKAGIPILLLYGGEDQTVIPERNCEPFAKRFKAAGGRIDVCRRVAYGHHPHGEEHGQTYRIADFFVDPR